MRDLVVMGGLALFCVVVMWPGEALELVAGVILILSDIAAYWHINLGYMAAFFVFCFCYTFITGRRIY